MRNKIKKQQTNRTIMYSSCQGREKKEKTKTINQW